VTSYAQRVQEFQQPIDAEWWQNPIGVDVQYDNLKFLYIPDYVETFIMAQIARQVYRYQVDNISTKQQMHDAVMITMGGLLPGVLLHDHLAWTLNKNIPAINFGTLGIKYYAGPGQPLDEPRIVHPLSIDVSGKVVGVIDDLVDLGGTAKFVEKYLITEKGAVKVVLIAAFLKNPSIKNDMDVIYFGNVPKDTWIITPREKVETLIKRVPYWRNAGASIKECEENLQRIGYPDYLIDIYLRPTYERG
jgi:hypoxanthine phosphoribosyltransferase